MSAPLVKIFGERNTGTRALHKMLRGSGAVTIRMARNLNVRDQERHAALSEQIDRHFTGAWRKLYRDALRDNNRHRTNPILTWKHAAPEWHDCFRQEQANVLFLIRNPYSWVVSMARRPYHLVGRRPENLTEFVTRPWLTQARDNTDTLLPDVLALWQAKVLAYRRFAREAKLNEVPTYFLQFEEFIADPVATAGAALSHFGVQTNRLRPAPSHTKGTGRSLAEIQAYYRQEKWRDRLSEEVVALINQRMDWDLAGRMGYRRLDPSEFGRQPAKALHGQTTGGVANVLPPPILLDRKASATSTA